MLSRTRPRKSALAVSLLAILVLVLASCGDARPGTGQGVPTSSDSGTPSPLVTIPTATSSPYAGPTQPYSDAKYGFDVKYPADFSVSVLSDAQIANFQEEGILRAATFFDRRYEGKETPGSVHIRVYEKGTAETLDEWVRVHSAPESDPPNDKVYFRETTNLREASVAGREGVRFEWDSSELRIVRAVAFYYKTYVVSAGWYAEGPDYETTIEPIFERILGSWKDG